LASEFGIHFDSSPAIKKSHILKNFQKNKGSFLKIFEIFFQILLGKFVEVIKEASAEAFLRGYSTVFDILDRSSEQNETSYRHSEKPKRKICPFASDQK
jgi:hypothetical protein